MLPIIGPACSSQVLSNHSYTKTVPWQWDTKNIVSTLDKSTGDTQHSHSPIHPILLSCIHQDICCPLRRIRTVWRWRKYSRSTWLSLRTSWMVINTHCIPRQPPCCWSSHQLAWHEPLSSLVSLLAHLPVHSQTGINNRVLSRSLVRQTRQRSYRTHFVQGQPPHCPCCACLISGTISFSFRKDCPAITGH